MEEVDENINGAIETTGTDRDAGIPKALDDMKHMNGQCVTGKTFDHREITTKDDNGTTSIQNGQCDLGEDCENSQLVEKVQTKTDPDSISSQNEYGNENSDIVKNGSDSTETDIVGNNIRPVIPMAKVMAKARNSLKDLAAKVLSSPDRRPDSETSITNENEKEEDHNEVLNDTNATETDSKEKKPDIRNENIEADIGPDSGGDLEMTDLDKENRLEDDLLNPNLEEGTHMEIASDSEDFLLQLSPDQDTENCKIKEEAPAEVQIKSKSDNNYKKSSPDHVEHTDVLNDDSNVAHLKESVQSVKTSGVLDKYNEGCVLNKTNICKNESIKLEKDDTHNSKSALEEVGDNKKPLEENDKKDSMCNEMPVKVVEIDITPEKSPQKKDSKKDDEDDDDDDVIFEGESKVDLTIRYKEPDPKDHPVNDDSIDQSKTETVKLEPKQTPETSVTPTSAHVIEDDDDVIFEKETKIDLSVQNICKENKNQHKSKESGCDWKTGVAKRTESSEAVIHEDEPNSKPICDKKETVTVGTSLQKGTDNKSSNIERKRAAEEPQLTSSDSKRSKLELVCTSKEVVSPVEEPASIDLIDSDEEMDTTDHTPTSVPQNDEGSSEEKEETKMITISAEELEALVRKKVKEYLAVQRDALLAQMSQKLQDFQSNNDLWKRQVKDLQVKVNDVTVLQQKHEKRKAHTAALRQITTRNVAVQVDDGRTGGTKIKPQVGTTNPSSPLLTIPKALPPAAGRIVTSPPGGTGTIRLPIPQSSIAPPIMTPMITQQPVTTDFKTPTVKSLLGTTRTQPTISCVAVTSPTSSGPIISMQHQRVVTASTSATTYISLPPGAVTSTSTKIITNSNRTTKIIDLTDDEPRMLVTLPQAVAPVGGTGVRTVLSQASQIVHAGFPNTSGTIQLVLASGSQPLKPGTIITGLPQNLIQSLPATPASAVNVTSPPGSSQPLVVTTVITHPRPAAPTLLQTSGLGTGLATAQVTGLASVPVTSLASAPVTSLASAPVTSLASVPVKGQALVPVMGIASAPVTSVAAVPVTGLASAQATSKAPAPTSAPSSTTTIVRASPLAPAKIMPNKHPAPFPLMNTLQKAESKCIPPKPSLRVSRVNQDVEESENSFMEEEDQFQETVYFDYSSFMNGEDMEQNMDADCELSSGPSGDMSFKIEKVSEENLVNDYCINMSGNIETVQEEHQVSDYCIILSENDEMVDNDGNPSSEPPQEPPYSTVHPNGVTLRDVTSFDNNSDTDSVEFPPCTENHVEIQKSDMRKHACFYCGKFYDRISIHYLRCHRKKAEVVRILKTPARSKDRKWGWDTLMKKGDSKHDLKTNRKKSGERVPKKQNVDQGTNTVTSTLVNDIVPEYGKGGGEDEDEQNQSEYQISDVSDDDDKRKTKRRFKGKRTPWSRKEQLAVLKHLGHCVKSGKTPCKKECDAVKKAAPKVLKHRTWVMIKLFVRNRTLKLAKKKKKPRLKYPFNL